MGTTFRLIILATVASILLGLVVGIITAVRQYSALDYLSTFAAFLFFSLPVFWLAVMLKEFGAIKFNDYLEQPGFSVVGIIVLAVLSGLIAAGLAGGSTRRRLIALGACRCRRRCPVGDPRCHGLDVESGLLLAGDHPPRPGRRGARGDDVRSHQQPSGGVRGRRISGRRGHRLCPAQRLDHEHVVDPTADRHLADVGAGRPGSAPLPVVRSTGGRPSAPGWWRRSWSV